MTRHRGAGSRAASSGHGGSRKADERIAKAVPLLVAAATVLAFLPALQAGFVAWDDDKNFLANPAYRGLGLTQLGWMWSTFHLGHYVPISWMTLGLDYVLWGMNPAGYHVTNLLLHAGNAVVVYFVARRLLRLTPLASTDSGPLTLTVPAALAALLFALHPLRVESVVWVTERRDVLSGLFYWLAVLFYLRACEPREDRRRWYVLTLAVFTCALLSKATSMTLPALLLILNVYPLRRLGGQAGWWSEGARRVYLELAPFAALAAATAILSIVALRPPEQLSAPAKLAVTAYSLAFYLWKTIAPVHLSPVYEMPQRVEPTATRFVLSYVVVVVLIAAIWGARHALPGVTAALLAFLAIILPMLGVVQNGPQIAADRYTYHAAPALAILAGAGFAVIARRRMFPVARQAAGAAILVGLAILSWNQSHVWRDSASLWSHVVQLDNESSVGHVGLANVLFKENRVDEATEHARRAVLIAPGYAQAHNDLGVGLARQGHVAAAVDEYQRALTIDPAYDEPRSNWGVVVAQQGDLEGAIEKYRQALVANPNNADAQVNWGNALVRLGKPDEAIEHYRQALRIRPDHADAEHNWGVALAREGKLGDAIVHFRRALQLNPEHVEANAYLEQATRLLQRGQLITAPDNSRLP